MPMIKRQVESIFLKVNYDVDQCHNSITKMKKLYKTGTTEADKLYNKLLDVIIQNYIDEYTYSANSEAVYC